VLEGLLKCAERFAAGGDRAAAAALYRGLSAAKYPSQVQIAAWRGLKHCGDVPTAREILRLLSGDDRLLRDAAAGSLRDLSANDLRAVADGLATLPAAGQEAVLAAIRLRGDKSLARVVLSAAESKEQPVRLAAVQALGIVGDGDALPLLLRLGGEEGRVGEAAWQSLEILRAPGIDERVIAALESENDALRRARLVGLVEARRPSQAVAVLLREATHPAAEVRSVAFAGLAQLAEPQDVPKIIALFLQAQAGPDREAAEKSIVLICQQLPGAQSRAEPCLAAFRAATPATRIELLPLVGRLGGAESRVAIVAAFQSQDPALRDAAVRALCNWPDASVADDLLKIVQSGDQEPHRTAALRGFIRVVSTPGTPDAQRLAQLQRAMPLASRDEERNLVLSRASAVRTVDTLRFLLPYLDQSALAEQACKSVAELGRHKELREPHRSEFGPALKKVLATSHDAATRELVRRTLAQ
jgi:HEAT repeat protein